ncbi:histidine permease [Knufia fluminis]|uniref:Histidine permease n=1 Tax=Knufia fluminis TaxID=191047 RepID=A0AAN8EDK0_9EURO|nr:histidine permease [Knufia fluminis]
MGTSDRVLLDPSSPDDRSTKHKHSISGSHTNVSITPFSGNSTFSKFEGDMDDVKKPLTARVVDSFRRDPAASVTRGSIGANKKRGFDAEAAAAATASSPLIRRLKGRHLQMIAIGGSIGTGLFVGTGRALAHGGPASILIAYCLIGTMMYCTVQALGEMAVIFPVAGSFAAYSTRFLDPAWGFAMGWNYAMQWLVVLPLEIVAASITVDFWNPNLSLNALWVAIFWLLICTINLFGVRGYGEAEFIFSTVKVTAVIGYIILGTLINICGGPGGSYIGFSNWVNPGAFNHGFKGLCSTFVTAAFAFAGTELVGLAAAETQNPRKTLPVATKQVFWRITLFYVLSVFIVGTLVPYDNPRLLSGSSDYDAKASPFVISIQNAGIEVFPSIMNAVILISVLSVGNSAIYGSSRTLAALAEQGQAPSMLRYIDRKGRPLVAILIASLIGALAFAAASPLQVEVFNWLIALSGLSSIFTWASINACHIRFRLAWANQGFGLDELGWRSPVGITGSYIGLTMNILILIAQFWTGFSPIGWQDKSTAWLVQNFFQAYLAAPVIVAFYIVYKVWKRPGYVRLRDVDLFTGRRDLNVKMLVAMEREEQRTWPRWKKIYKFLC